MEEINWLYSGMGLTGLILIINAVFIFKSSKYFTFLSKGFFIEPLTNDQKGKFKEFVSKNKGIDHLTTGIASFGLGIVAILWSVKIVKSITIFLFILAALILVVRYFYSKKPRTEDR